MLTVTELINYVKNGDISLPESCDNVNDVITILHKIPIELDELETNYHAIETLLDDADLSVLTYLVKETQYIHEVQSIDSDSEDDADNSDDQAAKIQSSLDSIKSSIATTSITNMCAWATMTFVVAIGIMGIYNQISRLHSCSP